MYTIKFIDEHEQQYTINVQSHILKKMNLFCALLEDGEDFSIYPFQISGTTIIVKNNIHLRYKYFCLLLEFLAHSNNATPMSLPDNLVGFKETANYCQAEGVLEDFINLHKHHIKAETFIYAHYPAQLIYNAYSGSESLIKEFLKHPCYKNVVICSLGYSIAQLKRYNIPASALIEANFSIKEVVTAYATTNIIELIHDGFRLAVLASNGHSGNGLLERHIGSFMSFHDKYYAARFIATCRLLIIAVLFRSYSFKRTPIYLAR